jgi:hypothetical protein
MQLVVSAVGIAIMVGFAALLEWFAAAGVASGGTSRLGQPMAGTKVSG